MLIMKFGKTYNATKDITYETNSQVHPTSNFFISPFRQYKRVYRYTKNAENIVKKPPICANEIVQALKSGSTKVDTIALPTANAGAYNAKPIKYI
jgi:hypothetical protein